MLHYLGCLEFWERETYRSSKHVSDTERQAIDTELRRISYMRDTLEKDDDEKLLVKNMTESMTRWRESAPYTDERGIEAVQRWRIIRPDGPLPIGITQRLVGLLPLQSSSDEYSPEYDINAHLISFENSKPRDIDTETTHRDKRFRGKFPNHKINITDLLEEKQEQGRPNPLSEARNSPEEEKIISYFHLPANNMIVSPTVL
jgi:hypothetical protein